METKKPTSKGLKALFIISAIVVVLYIGLFVAFAFLSTRSADADINGFANVMKYLLNSVGEILMFKRVGGDSEVPSFVLGVFAYGIALCCIIFTVTAFLVSLKNDRKVAFWALLMNYVDLILYLVFAGMVFKYWEIITNANGDILLKVLAIAIMALASIHFALAIFAFYTSLAESYNNPNLKSRYSFVNDEQFEAELRQAIRQELNDMQPFKIKVIKGAELLKQAEEPKEELAPEEEVVEEEPVINNNVSFWDTAREVWPQLDHPNPLPEEEPAPIEEVVEEDPVEEEPEEELPEFEEEPQEEVEGADDGMDFGGKKKRLSFMNRILKADSDIKSNYNEIKNEALSYGVKSRLSRSGDIFRLHSKRYLKIFLVGKTLKVYLALDPEDYKDSTIPFEDVGDSPACADLPMLFKVRSGLSVRRCKELIKATMEKNGFRQKEVKNINWVSELRKQNAEKAKAKKNQ